MEYDQDSGETGGEVAIKKIELKGHGDLDEEA